MKIRIQGDAAGDGWIVLRPAYGFGPDVVQVVRYPSWRDAIRSVVGVHGRGSVTGPLERAPLYLQRYRASRSVIQ